jgi:glutaredoxin
MTAFENEDRADCNIVLYTRKGCHLCDEAYALLIEHDVVPMLIDVDSQPVLQERFGECVPVVEINGQIRFRGRVEPLLLRRLLGRRR